MYPPFFILIPLATSVLHAHWKLHNTVSTELILPPIVLGLFYEYVFFPHYFWSFIFSKIYNCSWFAGIQS